MWIEPGAVVELARTGGQWQLVSVQTVTERMVP
jgi:hypothetical protein